MENKKAGVGPGATTAFGKGRKEGFIPSIVGSVFGGSAISFNFD